MRKGGADAVVLLVITMFLLYSCTVAPSLDQRDMQTIYMQFFANLQQNSLWQPFDITFSKGLCQAMITIVDPLSLHSHSIHHNIDSISS
jgi:hypothetical protein